MTTTTVNTMTIDERPRLRGIEYAYTIILALFLSALTVAVSAPTLDEVSARLGQDTPFASPVTQITFLRVAAGAWAVLFSFLQALVLAILISAIGRVRRPRVMVSWFWVLLGQLPFLIAAAGTVLFAGPSGTGPLAGTWSRICWGVVGVTVYALLARRQLDVDRRRLALFVGIAVLLNSALLLIGK